MIDEFIYKYIKISRSDSYMKSPEALYKKLKDNRTCVMYLSEYLYPTLMQVSDSFGMKMIPCDFV